ncbi:MAG: hypothetical protein KH216_07160 [Clostridiales bacterium]|nr:hypothetical protein [Clostridiales bacterium]
MANRGIFIRKVLRQKFVEDDYFNVDDYNDPEDFYEDYYDDFWDYYDAEEYFYEHHSYMNLE